MEGETEHQVLTWAVNLILIILDENYDDSDEDDEDIDDI